MSIEPASQDSRGISSRQSRASSVVMRQVDPDDVRRARATHDLGRVARAGVLQNFGGRSRMDTVTPRGTTERGRDSQRRIAEALIGLIDDGAAPTARAIADRAGVSLRLVFHHFESLEDIYRLAVVRLTVEHVDTLRPVEPSKPLPDRTEQTVRQRTKAYEAIGPVRRAASALEPSMPSLSPVLALADTVLAEHLRFTFAKELGRGGGEPGGGADPLAPPQRPDELLHALDAALSFEAWDRLRRVQGLSVVATRRAMVYAVTSLLSAGAADG